MKKKFNRLSQENGLSLVELLVSLVAGALTLSVLVVVSFNVFHVFNDNKGYTLTNYDNYNLTTMLHDMAQNAQSFNYANETIDLQYSGDPKITSLFNFLPSSFAYSKDVILQWNNNQLVAKDTSGDTAVLYTGQNNVAYSFSVLPNQSTTFELVPPSKTSQPAYFHVNNLEQLSKTAIPTSLSVKTTDNFSISP